MIVLPFYLFSMISGSCIDLYHWYLYNIFYYILYIYMCVSGLSYIYIYIHTHIFQVYRHINVYISGINVYISWTPWFLDFCSSQSQLMRLVEPGLKALRSIQVLAAEKRRVEPGDHFVEVLTAEALGYPKNKICDMYHKACMNVCMYVCMYVYLYS